MRRHRIRLRKSEMRSDFGLFIVQVIIVCRLLNQKATGR